MPSVTESSTAKSQLAAGLASGVNTLSYDQSVVFTQYNKVVSPIDGTIFWVNSAVTNGGVPITATVKGSLHYSSDNNQSETAENVKNYVLFTALSEVRDFNEQLPTQMYIGTFQGMRVAFSKRGYFYKQADLYHYKGFALYSTMTTQVVETAADLSVVVSNSLPLWLSLNTYFPVYPSMLIPFNAQPPYAAVHIEPGKTQTIAMAPRMNKTSIISVLAKDEVKITMYGVRNDMALDYQEYLYQNSLNTDNFGLMSPAVLRDEKVNQSEFNILAVCKTLTLEVSYYQSRVQNVARKLILQAHCAVTLSQ